MIKIESRVFVNFTNHPSRNWEKKQLEEAEKYGTITDLPFPAVDPAGDEAYIEALAKKYAEQIMGLHPQAVLCQGEFTLVYRVVTELKKRGILVLAACSERRVRESGNKKEVVFEFIRFRKF